MGKATESLKDKGAVVSAFPADYFHNSSPTPECSCSGTEVLFIHLTLLAATTGGKPQQLKYSHLLPYLSCKS